MKRIAGCVATATILLGLSAAPAVAVPINWTTWSSASPSSTAGSASGSITGLGVGVTYSGEVQSLVANYPSWSPSGTFSGGTVGNPPLQSGGIIQLFGGGTVVDTITFSQPIVDPIMAIWSLGQGGLLASFVFTASEPFTIQSGGPSAEYGGSSIVGGLNLVSGIEGNGTIQFDGTFSQISWTNPQFENWYGFTIGATAVGEPSPVPEPATLALLGMGLMGAAAARRRHKRVA
jgi:hypothetical protein